MDIPIAMMIESCASSQERQPRLVGIANNLATRSVAIFNFLSLIMDVLVVNFIKKTILPISNPPPLELFDGGGQLPVGRIAVETNIGKNYSVVFFSVIARKFNKI